MIRSLRPTDVVAYLKFRKTGPIDHAVSITGRPVPPPDLPSFLNQSLRIAAYQETWIQIENGQMMGMAAVKARFGADTWEIDHLLVSHADDLGQVVQRLLEHLSAAALENGVQVIQLRLDQASPTVQAAINSGFVRYAAEDVYWLSPPATRPGPMPHSLRPRRPSDHQLLFQLYCAMVPASARQFEGMTLQEWRWFDGWGMPAVGFRLGVSARRDFVLPIEESLAGWVQIDTRRRTIRSELDSRAETQVDSVIAFALHQLGTSTPTYWIVRDHQRWLGRVLEERGFQLDSTHLLLAKQLAVRVQESKLVPARA